MYAIHTFPTLHTHTHTHTLLLPPFHPHTYSFSPLPSPASVSSTGSGCSGGGASQDTSPSATVSVPKHIFNKATEHLNITTFLTQSFELWKYSDVMLDQCRGRSIFVPLSLGSHAPEHEHWSCAGRESLVFFCYWWTWVRGYHDRE